MGAAAGCADNTGGDCVPTAERCNNLDDDCNGLVDDNGQGAALTQACTTPQGQAGVQSCAAGVWGACTFVCTPQPEECNGIDDDCDGEIDEGGSSGRLRRPCQTDCGSGYEYCYDGVWEQCDAPVPQAEVCDGVDNDCDTEVDEGCACVHGATRPCGTNEGACREGTESCVNGVWSGTCVGEIAPAANDAVCNGIDDDCDGDVDEDCTCTPGTNQQCGTDEGVCSFGSQTCVTGGTWGECTGGVGPQSEAGFGCDGLDNDCDGEIDEDLPPDTYENNNTCAGYRNVPATSGEPGEVWEDEGTATLQATLYPSGDVDWYHLVAREVAHLGCGLGTDQCFALAVSLQLPVDLTSADVVATVSADFDNDCSNGTDADFVSTSAGTWDGRRWTVVIQWSGECNFLF
ncbi:MAG: MopE-related protein, partial [Polyangia bacterium]|nr:MopE-related protein [Polyangia bacterium]